MATNNKGWGSRFYQWPPARINRVELDSYSFLRETTGLLSRLRARMIRKPGRNSHSQVPFQVALLRAMLDNGSNNLDVVSHLHNLVHEHPDFEALHETTLNGYCFRYAPNGLADRQDEPDVQALIDVLTEEIVQAVHRDGFAGVTAICVKSRAAILVSFYPGQTSLEVDATFDAIAHWGHLLSQKLSVRYEPEMETKICLSESLSSPTEL